LVFLRIIDHFPEKLTFAKLVLDPNLEFIYVWFIHPPPTLTPLYQKFNFIAISRCGKGINDEECGGPRLGADSTVCSGSMRKRQTLSLGSLDYALRHALCPMRTSE
jgi:hypothetical protein